jgi:hypothetical protein
MCPQPPASGDVAKWPIASFLARTPVYAAPNVFGPWETVANHGGSITFTISVEPIGDTVVTGEVRYYGENNSRVVEGFFQKTTITTSNSYGIVEVRLKGTPSGASCWVDVTP